MSTNNRDFFWPSYVDLMTGLFVTILVLFVLSYKGLSDQKKATEEQLDKIKEIQNATTQLDPYYFEYQQEYKRFQTKEQIQFESGSSILPTNQIPYLIAVGKSIQGTIEVLKEKFAKDSIKYLVAIEGMASDDAYYLNYELSYKRAQALYTLWQEKSVLADKSVCEFMISGSGIGGVGRFSKEREKENQRILIQILPKISRIAIAGSETGKDSKKQKAK